MRRSSLHVFGVMTLALCAAISVDAGRHASAAETKSIAIITMVDTPQLVEVKDGVLKGLAAHGYNEKNLKIDFKSAQSNFGTAQQIARQFIGEAPDAIVTITTPATQAVVAATKEVPV